MMDDAMSKQIPREDQFSTMRRHGRIPITHDIGGSSSKEAAHYKQHQLPRSAMPAEASMSTGDGGCATSSWVKPGCMMELARLAKIPQPESGLMCPRCQSTETKFCYYNNYSLSQPRHFCKTCRRYWTHGGALRDLPFASSVRRRRNKPAPSNNNRHTSSKVACCASGTGRAAAATSSSSGATVASRRSVVPAAMAMPPLEQLPLPPQLHQLGVGGGDHRRTSASRIWFPGRHSSQQDPMGYRHHLGNSIGTAFPVAVAAANFNIEHQRYLPQRQPFSFLGYYKNGVTATTSAICPFSAEGGAEAGGFAGPQMQAISMIPRELASETMMMAENQPIIPSTEMMGTLTSSPREFLVGLHGENDLHFLGSGRWACGYGSTMMAGNSGGGSICTAAPANVWADRSGFTSSSSGTIL